MKIQPPRDIWDFAEPALAILTLLAVSFAIWQGYLALYFAGFH